MVEARRLEASIRQCKFFSFRLLIFLIVYSSSSIFFISFAIFLQRWTLAGKGPWWGSLLLLTSSSKGKCRPLLLRRCSLIKQLPRGRAQAKMIVLPRRRRVNLLRQTKRINYKSPPPHHWANKGLMSAQGPIIFGPIQRLVSHKEYAVEMVNSIIKDTDLDKCGEHGIKDLGVSSFFDLARISIHRVYIPFFFYFSPL